MSPETSRSSPSRDRAVEYPAEAYERVFVAVLSAPWADDVMRRVAPRPGEHVLDVACGTGIVARRAARHVAPGGLVVGVDADPGMLEVARTAAAAEEVDVEWRQGRVEALPVESAMFDLVTCQVGLMFFDDRSTALREMHRALGPGGRIAVSVPQGIERYPFHVALDDIIARHLGESVLIRTIFSLGTASGLRSLVEGAGFHDITVDEVVVTGRFPDVRELVRLELMGAEEVIPGLAAMDPADREIAFGAVIADGERAARPYISDGALVMEARTHVAIGRR